MVHTHFVEIYLHTTIAVYVLFPSPHMIAVYDLLSLMISYTTSACPHDTIVVYDSSLWRMRLCHKSAISACYSLTNVAIGPEDSWLNRIGQNEQSYRTVALYKNRGNGPLRPVHKMKLSYTILHLGVCDYVIKVQLVLAIRSQMLQLVLKTWAIDEPGGNLRRSTNKIVQQNTRSIGIVKFYWIYRFVATCNTIREWMVMRYNKQQGGQG